MMTDEERHEALRQLAEDWWEPPADLIDTLPKGGVELRYLSHIWVRKAFQDADPDWSWEPMGYDDHGQPVIVTDSQGHPVGLWIWLNLLGTRMPGYGSVEPGKRDAIKELIGDALRNAGMRLVGGSLWVKQTKKPKGRAPAKKATPADRAIEHLREQVDEAPHHEKAAGKDLYDRLCAEHSQEIVNGALATHSIATFSELTPAKGKAIEASLVARARLVKEQEDRAEQLAREKAAEQLPPPYK
jgi:hypothetical protein